MASAGRGRGRGRGLLAKEVIEQALSRPGEAAAGDANVCLTIYKKPVLYFQYFVKKKRGYMDFRLMKQCGGEVMQINLRISYFIQSIFENIRISTDPV